MLTGAIGLLLAGPTVIDGSAIGLGWQREQVRFPRSKKRRIRKKWAKRPENWRRLYVDGIYQIGPNTYVADPLACIRIRAELYTDRQTAASGER